MIVVDSSSIISLAVNCMCPLLSMVGGEYAITPKVYDEIISTPSENKRFALEAMRVKQLVSSGTVKVLQPKGRLHEDILDAANRIYRIKGRELKIIHHGEAEAIALASEVKAAAIMMDERTLRLLMEDPQSLRELLAFRNKSDVYADSGWLKRLKEVMPNIPVIRSAEIVAVAYEKGYLTQLHDVKDKSVLNAALAALKFSGCAISWEEIGEYEKVVI